MNDNDKQTEGGRFWPSRKKVYWVVGIVLAQIALMLGSIEYGKWRGVPMAVNVPLVPMLQGGPDDFTPTFGWVRDEEVIRDNLDPLKTTQFDQTPAGRAVMADGDGDVYLWRAVRKAGRFGADRYPNVNQQNVGCCVGCGWKHGVDVLLATQLAAGRQEEWRPVSVEVIYGGSRVEVGGGRISGDGSVGAWAARFVKDYGVVPMAKHGDIDLTTFSPARAREFGRAGVPDTIEPLARQHPVKGTALVKSWADAEKSIRQGYPVVVCSNQGFRMDRDRDGFARPQGQWAHCVPRGTMISTQVPKACEDVVVGDKVVGHDGKLHNVKEVYTRPFDGNLVVLHANGMVPTKFTPGHPVLVYRRFEGHGQKFTSGLNLAVYAGGKYARLVPAYTSWQEDQPQWVPAEDIRPGDYLLSPHLSAKEGVIFPDWDSASATTKYHPKWPYAPTADLAWLFGLYIADGNASKDHRVVITLNKHEQDKADRAMAAFASLGLAPRLVKEETFLRVIVDSAIAANSFREWFGTCSADKHIPEWLYSGWDKEALISGYVAGDGCKTNQGYTTSTTSYRLALQVHQLLLTLGERPSMQVQPRCGTEYPNAAPGWTVAWTTDARRHIMRHWNGYYLMPVHTVGRERYTGTVWNYEVDDAHSYLSNNIVSHNCMMLCGVRGGDRPGGFILNSWGDNAHTGGVFPADMPVAGFWADAAVVDGMLRQGDSFAISDAVGFPARRVPIDWFIRLPRPAPHPLDRLNRFNKEVAFKW